MAKFLCVTSYMDPNDPGCAFERKHERDASTSEEALAAEIRQAAQRIEEGLGADGFRVSRVTVVEDWP